MMNSSNGKNNDYIIEPAQSPVALKSTYNETSLEAYLNDNSISQTGTMLKRVDGTDPDNRLDINDPDFQASYEKEVWNVDQEAFKKQSIDGFSLPDATGDWTANYSNDTDTATFTKVVMVNGEYVPDTNHDPIIINTPTVEIRDIAKQLSGEMAPAGTFLDSVNGNNSVGSVNNRKSTFRA